MKIFADFSNINPSESRPEPLLSVWPDSCLLLSNRPLFVPDFDENFYAIPALAAKIGRIGKCIAKQFASRYISELTLAFIILPKKALDLILKGEEPSSSRTCFDSAIVIGQKWERLEELPSDIDTSFELSDSGQNDSLVRSVNVPTDGLTATVSEISKTNTVKNGDIVLAPIPGFYTEVKENDIFKGFFSLNTNSELIIETRFK